MDGDSRGRAECSAFCYITDDAGRASFGMEFSHFEPKRQRYPGVALAPARSRR